MRECCDACRWLVSRTGVSDLGLDTALYRAKLNDLVEGDILRTENKPAALGRHGLGYVVDVSSVAGSRQKQVSILWEHLGDEPVVVTSDGQLSSLVMKREGERRIIRWGQATGGPIRHTKVLAPWGPLNRMMRKAGKQ